MGGETDRLAALRALEVLDSPQEAEFDLITKLAAELFNVPVALLSLVDANRQWFKSRHGLDVCETGRGVAFCSHAIEQEGVFEIPDATADPRFSGNMLVVSDPNIRYYAGAPLTLRSGYRIGTLCLIDFKPRVPLAPDQRASLARLAELAAVQLELRRLRAVGAMSNALMKATPDAIVSADASGFITQWNDGAERMFGYSAAEAIDSPLELIVPPEFRPAHAAGFARFISGATAKLVGQATVEVPAMRRNGERFPIELSLAAWRNTDGKIGGVGAIIRDIGDKKALEAEKEQSKRFLDTVLEHLPAMLFVKDAVSREYLLWNKTGEETTGLAREDVLGRTDAQLFPGVGEDFMKRDEKTLRLMLPQSFESRFTRPDGQDRVLRTRRIAVPDEKGGPRYLLGISEDVTEWRAAQDRLLFLAGHDPLTHLKNRVSFEERLAARLADGELAVLGIDLDRFKAVNDSHGHHVGDRLLQAVARLLEQLTAADANGLVARLSGDEFAVLLAGPGALVRATRFSEGLLAGLNKALDLDELHLRTSASIGIAVAPEHGEGAAELMANADLALYRAKKDGRGRYCYFDVGMDQAARERRRIEAKLRDAIACDAIRLHFQPLASLESGRVVAFEALARWRDPELGDIRPDIFVPIAEECGLIGRLGSKVLRMAIAEASRWAPPLGVSVNLSPIQVESPDFCDEVAALLAEHDLPASRLELEVTEGVMIRDADAALATLRRLKALGVSIAMDDFGTGYSSLSYFRLFPFDKVKIDQSFVREMGNSAEALAIVQAVIGLARGLGLPVVAEGVENDEQFNMLLAEGCTQVQGYLLGRPAPIESFCGAVIESRTALEHFRMDLRGAA